MSKEKQLLSCGLRVVWAGLEHVGSNTDESIEMSTGDPFGRSGGRDCGVVFRLGEGELGLSFAGRAVLKGGAE